VDGDGDRVGIWVGRRKSQPWSSGGGDVCFRPNTGLRRLNELGEGFSAGFGPENDVDGVINFDHFDGLDCQGTDVRPCAPELESLQLSQQVLQAKVGSINEISYFIPRNHRSNS
jgi:hypothetical protein